MNSGLPRNGGEQRRGISPLTAMALVAVAIPATHVVDRWNVADMPVVIAKEIASDRRSDDQAISASLTRLLREIRPILEAMVALADDGNEEARAALATIGQIVDEVPKGRALLDQLRMRVARGDTDDQIVRWVRDAVR